MGSSAAKQGRRPAGGLPTPARPGSGRRGPVRHQRKALRAPAALTRSSVRKLARRGGVKRISAGVYGEAPAALRAWLGGVVGDAVVLAEHARRATVILNDVLLALKRHGIMLYGFEATERRERRRQRLMAPLPAAAVQEAAERARRAPELQERAPEPVQEPAEAAPAGVLAEALRTLPPGGLADAVRRAAQREAAAAASAAKARAEAAARAAGAPAAAPPPPRRPSTSAAATSPRRRAAAAAPAAGVAPERAAAIQNALFAFTQEVLEPAGRSDGAVAALLPWVAARLAAAGAGGCAAAELDAVLEALAARDAVMLAEGDAARGRVAWFV